MRVNNLEYDFQRLSFSMLDNEINAIRDAMVQLEENLVSLERLIVRLV